MPPRNLRGGKAYKKKKKPTDVGADGKERMKKFEPADESGQNYGRVIRLLGNRRCLCFCNDGYERVCKIRGALCKGPKRQKIEIGDIVLLSFREFESDSGGLTLTGTSETTGAALELGTSGRKEIADLIDVFPHEHWRDIRSQPTIHARLFEVMVAGAIPTDDIFDGSGSDTDTGSDTGSESDSSVDFAGI